MKLHAWRSVALSSALLAALLGAATRPRYGGTLALQTDRPATTLSLADPDAAPLIHLVFETLVRLDGRAQPKPHLAFGFQHDAEFKRWRITLRSRIVFHDGSALTAASALPAIAAAFPGSTVTAAQQMLTMQFATPAPNLLRELASNRAAIVRKAGDGALIGTGPFRIEKGASVLRANEAYWGGRPFLDSITISESGPADVIALPAGVGRRVIPQRFRTWISPLYELLAIQATGVQPSVRRALSLAVDRDAIANVLTQRWGQSSGALLPQWLSGHAFLFTPEADATRARQLMAEVQPPVLTLGHSSADPLARAIAERVAVNARDAGITIQLSTLAPSPQLRLIRLRLSSISPEEALGDAATELGLAAEYMPASLYERERRLLDDDRAIPLIHVPDVFALHPRVRGWEEAHSIRDGRLHFEDVWLEP